VRKGRFQDESGKRHEKCQQPAQHHSLMLQKSWVMVMMHQTDNEHGEYMKHGAFG